MVRLLVELGADVNKRDEVRSTENDFDNTSSVLTFYILQRGWAGLTFATATGNVEMVRCLVTELVADVDSRCKVRWGRGGEGLVD
jgi:hypothetical protein